MNEENTVEKIKAQELVNKSFMLNSWFKYFSCQGFGLSIIL